MRDLEKERALAWVAQRLWFEALLEVWRRGRDQEEPEVEERKAA